MVSMMATCMNSLKVPCMFSSQWSVAQAVSELVKPSKARVHLRQNLAARGFARSMQTLVLLQA